MFFLQGPVSYGAFLFSQPSPFLTNLFLYVTFLEPHLNVLRNNILAFDKTAIIQNAQKFTIKGQIDKAIEEWQKIVKESPNDGNTFNTIGDLYLKKNNNQEAISSYLKAAKAFDFAGFSLKTIAVYKKIIKINPENIEIQIKMADLDAERGLVGNAIEEYLKVVRHYSKSGLHQDATLIYKKIVNLDPNNVQMRLMLASLCEKAGEKKEAIEQYIQIAKIYRTQGKILEGEDALKRALTLEPGDPQATQLLKEFQSSDISAPSPGISSSQEGQYGNSGGESLSGEVSFQEFSMTDEPSGVRKEPIKQVPIVETETSQAPKEISAQEKTEEKIEKASSDVSQIPSPVPSDANSDSLLSGSAEPDQKVDFSAFDTSFTPAPQESSETTEAPSYSELDDEKVKEKMAEGEFYTQQGLLSEAKIIYETILKYAPGNVLARAKLNEISNSLNETSTPASASFEQVFSEPPSTPPEEPFIPNQEKVVEPASPQPDHSPGKKVFTPGTVKLKTTVLDKTEKTDFVNLMGELEGEFKEEVVAPSDEEVQDDDFGKIIKEFQKGIQANIGEKDFETHFDLGIAYKEMGLRTEAIGEFQISIKGGARAVDSAILLSQCYLEDGLPKLAIEQLTQAIKMKQLNEDQMHSLKYELAALYEIQKNHDEALDVLSDIYKENVNYRDVSKKISQIRQNIPRKA